MLSRLPDEERVQHGLDAIKEIGDPSTDDETAARYAEAKLQQSIRKLGLNLPDESTQQSDKQARRVNGKPPKTLTNGQAAEASAGSLHTDDTERKRALKLIDQYMRTRE